MPNSLTEKDTLALTVAKNAGLGFGGNLISMALRVAISIAITRSIGPESYGIYVLALAIISFFETLAVLGMGNTVVKFVSQFKTANDSPRLRGTILYTAGVAIVLSTVLCIALVYMAPSLIHHLFEKPPLIPVLVVMALSLPFSTLTTIFLASLQGIKFVKHQILVDQLLNPLFRLAFVILALSLDYHLQGVAWSYVLSQFFAAMLSAFFLLRNLPEMAQGARVTIEAKTLTLFSIPLLFSALFNRLMARLDILLMGHFLPAAMVGIYGTAQRFMPLIGLPLGAFNNIFAPIIADLFHRDRKETLEDQFKIVAKWIFMTTLPIFVLFTSFSKEILSVFGSAFTAGSEVMILLCIGQMVNAASGSSGFILVMTDKPQANLLNSALLCVMSTILNLYFVPRYGIVGAAWASALSITILQIVRLAEVWHFLRIHPYRRDFMKPFFSGSAAFLLLVIALYFSKDGGGVMMIFPWFLLFLLTYTGLLWVLKLSDEDRLILCVLQRKFFKQEERRAKHTPSRCGEYPGQAK